LDGGYEVECGIAAVPTRADALSGDKAKVGERSINIGGKASVLMGKGDRLVIMTPGGGAWGSVKS